MPSEGIFMPNMARKDFYMPPSLVSNLEKSGHKAYNHALYWSI